MFAIRSKRRPYQGKNVLHVGSQNGWYVIVKCRCPISETNLLLGRTRLLSAVNDFAIAHDELYSRTRFTADLVLFSVYYG